MHKKISKAIAGSLMSAAMLATAVTSVIAPMSASAQMLGQTDFDDGTGLPWHTCETNPAKQTFDIDGGSYNCHVVTNKGAEGRWDLQFRHRGLNIVAGHTYEIKAEVTADVAGWFYTKISPIAGSPEVWNDAGNGQWQPIQLSAGQTYKINTTFTANSTYENAEWAFHYAYGPGNKWNHTDTGIPDGGTISFDNLSLVDKTDPNNKFDTSNEFGVVRPQTNVRANQIGYYQGLAKKASYVTDAEEALDFEVIDTATNEVVYTGKTVNHGPDPDSGSSKTEQVKIEGIAEPRMKYKDSGANVHIIDFSDIEASGSTYKIVVKDTVGVSGTQVAVYEGAFDTTINGDKVEWTNPKTGVTYTMNESHEFRIDKSIYDGLLKNAFNYYYQNRTGIPIEADYITSGDKTTLSHTESGHVVDKAYVQPEWKKSYISVDETDRKYQIDGTGGWYDAGDHGKYVVNGGVSVWTLQNMYEMSKKLGTDSKWTDGTVVIPEGKDTIPDALQEAKVELDWFFTMVVDSKDPYYGKNAGMVYHKLHDCKWTGLAIHAWAYEGFEPLMEDGARIVKPPTYAATLNMVACAAQASRLWEEYDSAYAAKCLDYAKKGYDAVINSGNGWKVEEGDYKTDPLFAPLDQAIGGGAYGDTYVYDDMYWAASELYITTGDAKYKTMLESYENPNDSTGKDKAYSLTANLGGGENKGSLSSFNWGCTSGLGTLSLYLNSDKLDAADAAKVKQSITDAADVYLEEQANQGMGIPYKGTSFTDPINIGDEVVTGYEWGSNSFVINNAIVMSYAYDATNENKYINGAGEALDYIFGRNGNDFSYVSGYGDVSLTYPHHRFWAHGVDSSFPLAPAGCLSGGPGAGMQDPYIGGLGYKRGTLASQKCYVDNAEAWSVNEITINWNAPLCWMASYMDDIAPNVELNVDPTDPPASTGEGKVTLWGDANEDGFVTVADATAVLQAIGNKDKYGLEPQGAANADVVDNGGGLSGVDALAIQYLELGLLTQEQCPVTSAQLDAIGK